MRVEKIIKDIKDLGLTAYEIAKDTDLTEVGINKIINGTSKNPREKTLNILENYITNYKTKKHNNFVNEPNLVYGDSSVKPILYDEEVEILKNKNGINFYLYPDETTKIEVLKIPFPAYASYLEAFTDEEKLHDQFTTTTFSVDKVGRGYYLGFDIKNDSMNGGGIDDTPSGAEVLAREIGRHLWNSGFHKSRYGFILMTRDAIYHKDIKDYNTSTGKLTLSSRNPDEQDFEIDINNVFRIFNVIKRTF